MDKINYSLIFSDDLIVKDKLGGDAPYLDSFAASIALVNINRSINIEKLQNYPYIPAHVFYQQKSYYRAYGCHELMEPFAPYMIPPLHLAVGKSDFVVNFMSPYYIGKSEFYTYYPVFLSYGQFHEKKIPPSGGQTFDNGKKYFFRLFHYTTKECKESILNEKHLRTSKRNFCGTRFLKSGYCYFTDVAKVKNLYDTLPVLIRKHRECDSFFISDDMKKIKKINLEIDDRKLTDRIAFLLSPNIIQPNPMVYHHNIKGQPNWLEIMFPNIYRCPCDGIQIIDKVVIDNEDHWIIDAENAIDMRFDDPISVADGNNIESLLALIDDYSL